MDYSELPELPPEQEEPLFASAQPTEPDRDDTDALFAVLNLDRDCTADDIKREYKRLAALLHPDRHPLAKEAADTHFQTLNHAYEVLSDPKKRIIYESLGEEGLKTTWEVGNKFKTADELRAEFQRLGRKQLEADVENLVKSRADLTCTVDARVLFLADDERRDLGGPTQLSLQQKLETVTVKQLFLKHSFTTPVTAATSVVLTSQMLARQGVGAGNMLIKVVHRPSSKISLELGTTLLRPRAFSLKGTYSPDSDTFLTFDAPLRNLASPPQLSVTIGRRISENFTLTFSARTGQWAFLSWGRASVQEISSSTISVGLINSAGWSLDATTGVQVGQLSGDYGQTVLGGVKVRLGGMLSTQGGWSTTLSGEKRVTENTKAAMVLELGMNGTMTVRLRLTRLGQRLVLPITVSSSLNPTLVVTFTVLPALSMIAAHHLIILPRKKRRFTSRIVELREENSEYIAEKRKEAVDAVTLLQDHVAKRVEVERANNGLIIIKATYGILPLDSAPLDPSALALDVTIALQSLVANSQLVIPGGRSKSNLLGFYDCAMGEQKQLHVRYLFKGRLHEFTVEDRGAVSAPLRAHWIDA